MNRAQQRRRVAAEFYYKPEGITGVEADWIESGVDDEVDPDVVSLDLLLVRYEEDLLKQLRAAIVREPITQMDPYHREGQADMKRAILAILDSKLESTKKVDLGNASLPDAAPLPFRGSDPGCPVDDNDLTHWDGGGAQMSDVFYKDSSGREEQLVSAEEVGRMARALAWCVRQLRQEKVP